MTGDLFVLELGVPVGAVSEELLFVGPFGSIEAAEAYAAATRRAYRVVPLYSLEAFAERLLERDVAAERL